MYNFFNSRKSIFLLCSGIVLLLISISIFVYERVQYTRIMRHSEQVTAEILNVRQEVRVSNSMNPNRTRTQTSIMFDVEFEVDGQLISTAMRGWSHPRMSIGMPIELYVNRQNPYEFMAVGAGSEAWYSLIISLIFIFIGGRKQKDKAEEMENEIA